MADTIDSVSPETKRSAANKLFAVCAALLFAAFAFQLWFHAVRTSATFDEPAHAVAGYRYWQCGDFGINPEHPPLLKLLATAHLRFRAALVEPKAECGARLTPKAEMFNLGGEFLSDNGVDSILIPARLLAALMSLGLAALVFLTAREMFGRWEALTALAILAFEPNLIAHGALVTTDMALTATAFGAVYALYRYLKNPNWARFFVLGLAFGLMLSAKHSAIVFLPILFIVFVADAVFYRQAETRLPKLILHRTAAFAGFFLIGLILLWSFYGFRFYALPNAAQPAVSIDEYIRANGRPEAVESTFSAAVRTVNKLRVFPESYTLGLADIAATNSRNVWIFGRDYATGQWFYFPLAFLVKSSVALLVLLPFGFVFALVEKEKRREMFFLLAPALLFFAFSLTSKINIGVRHILPVYGFFIVAAAVGAVWLMRKSAMRKPARSKDVSFSAPLLRADFRIESGAPFVLIALLVFHAVSAWRTAPNYIAFANDFFGGANNSHLIFRDSNVDWGQNYKLIDEYLRRETISDCWFAGFGNQEIMRVSQPCRLLPDSRLQRFSTEIFDAAPPVVEGTILVSVSNLPPRGGDEYAPLMKAEPLAQIGGTIFVYRGRFELPLAAALSRTTRANQFVSLKRFDEAVAEGRAAVELAPNDARTHLALALALLRAGQKTEARSEFEIVVEKAKSNPALFRNQEVRAAHELERLNK